MIIMVWKLFDQSEARKPWEFSRALPGKCQSGLEHPILTHIEFSQYTQQIWAQSEQRFVCKCTEIRRWDTVWIQRSGEQKLIMQVWGAHNQVNSPTSIWSVIVSKVSLLSESLGMCRPLDPLFSPHIRLEGPEDPHLRNSRFSGHHMTPLTLQCLWPRPPGVWLGGPGCKPEHSGWS